LTGGLPDVYSRDYEMSTTTPTKTYSFKAPLEWEDRLDRALKTLADLPGFDSAEGAQIRQELELSILRNPEPLLRAGNQSGLMRALVEVLLAATEKVERDRTTAKAYAAAAAEREADEREFTRASTRAAARRWHER
jgi:hypothetical protein